jgi:hypothetical protein
LVALPTSKHQSNSYNLMREQGYRFPSKGLVRLLQPDLFQSFVDRSARIEEIEIAISLEIVKAMLRVEVGTP